MFKMCEFPNPFVSLTRIACDSFSEEISSKCSDSIQEESSPLRWKENSDSTPDVVQSENHLTSIMKKQKDSLNPQHDTFFVEVDLHSSPNSSCSFTSSNRKVSFNKRSSILHFGTNQTPESLSDLKVEYINHSPDSSPEENKKHCNIAKKLFVEPGIESDHPLHLQNEQFTIHGVASKKLVIPLKKVSLNLSEESASKGLVLEISKEEISIPTNNHINDNLELEQINGILDENTENVSKLMKDKKFHEDTFADEKVSSDLDLLKRYKCHLTDVRIHVERLPDNLLEQLQNMSDSASSDDSSSQCISKNNVSFEDSSSDEGKMSSFDSQRGNSKFLQKNLPVNADRSVVKKTIKKNSKISKQEKKSKNFFKRYKNIPTNFDVAKYGPKFEDEQVPSCSNYCDVAQKDSCMQPERQRLDLKIPPLISKNISNYAPAFPLLDDTASLLKFPSQVNAQQGSSEGNVCASSQRVENPGQKLKCNQDQEIISQKERKLASHNYCDIVKNPYVRLERLNSASLKVIHSQNADEIPLSELSQNLKIYDSKFNSNIDVPSSSSSEEDLPLAQYFNINGKKKLNTSKKKGKKKSHKQDSNTLPKKKDCASNKLEQRSGVQQNMFCSKHKINKKSVKKSLANTNGSKKHVFILSRLNCTNNPNPLALLTQAKKKRKEALLSKKLRKLKKRKHNKNKKIILLAPEAKTDDSNSMKLALKVSKKKHNSCYRFQDCMYDSSSSDDEVPLSHFSSKDDPNVTMLFHVETSSESSTESCLGDDHISLSLRNDKSSLSNKSKSATHLENIEKDHCYYIPWTSKSSEIPRIGQHQSVLRKILTDHNYGLTHDFHKVTSKELLNNQIEISKNSVSKAKKLQIAHVKSKLHKKKKKSCKKSKQPEDFLKTYLNQFCNDFDKLGGEKNKAKKKASVHKKKHSKKELALQKQENDYQLIISKMHEHLKETCPLKQCNKHESSSVSNVSQNIAESVPSTVQLVGHSVELPLSYNPSFEDRVETIQSQPRVTKKSFNKMFNREGPISKHRLGFLSSNRSLRLYNRCLVSERLLLSRYQMTGAQRKKLKKMFSVLKSNAIKINKM